MTEERNCGNCGAFKLTSDESWHECHLHPPVRCGGDGGPEYFRWPLVRKDEFCLDWQPTPKEKGVGEKPVEGKEGGCH